MLLTKKQEGNSQITKQQQSTPLDEQPLPTLYPDSLDDEIMEFDEDDLRDAVDAAVS